MKAANVSINLIILAVCDWLFWETYNFTTAFAQDGIGPAYFPRIILTIIMIASFLELIASFKLEKRTFIPKSERALVIRLVLFICVVGLFIGLLGVVSFILNASVSLFLLSMILKLPVLPSIVTSVVLSTVVYYVFTAGFNIIL